MPRRGQRKKTSNPMQTIVTRFLIVVGFFGLWIGVIGVRLVQLQVNQHEELLGRATGQRRETVKEKQLRGTIYDRTNRALAMTVPVKSLYANPDEITDLDAASREIAKALKTNPSEIAKKLKDARGNKRKYVVLAPKLEDEAFQRVNQVLENKELRKSDLPKFEGLHWQEDQKRSYPYNTLAAQVLGFSNAEDVGSAGIEQSQERVLRGEVIKTSKDRDRLGRVYGETETERLEPPRDVYLTLSHSIQYKAELALEKGVRNANAKSGMAVVLDPRNGEILAMANYPTFDPNRFREFTNEQFVNRAVHDSYSPGSVFKLVTYGAGINEGAINPDGIVDCGNGTLKIPGREIVDKHCVQRLNYVDAMAVSSNIAAMKTATAVGRDKFHFYAQRFGFGVPSGVELPAETGGILRAPNTWNGDSLASMSIGYEIGVSVLQMATAFATIANDGIRVQPHIIKEIKQADGSVVPAAEVSKTQVVTPETARVLKKMLRQVVLTGTGKRAQLSGYTSAGKTGTAWKYDAKLKKINQDKYVSSFIGFAPFENSGVVIAVVLDEPRVGARDGGQVAAPIFQEIAEQILPELNVAPDANIRPGVYTAAEIPSEIEPSTKDGKSRDSNEKTVAGKKEDTVKVTKTAALATDGRKIKSSDDKQKKKT
ncbi:MAG: penicillin-binding protein 2 [Acidobacteria bacterium]|nr:penicillin-binding protein 2 [Acidobacteriota bacterium]